MWEGNLDPLLIESVFDASLEFSADRPLLDRPDLTAFRGRPV